MTAAAKSKTFGDGDPALTYTASALTRVTATRAPWRGPPARPSAATRSRRARHGADPNYTITFVGANLTITAQAVTVTAEANSEDLRDADPALTYTASALNGRGRYAGILARDTGETVGSTRSRRARSRPTRTTRSPSSERT